MTIHPINDIKEQALPEASNSQTSFSALPDDLMCRILVFTPGDTIPVSRKNGSSYQISKAGALLGSAVQAENLAHIATQKDGLSWEDYAAIKRYRPNFLETSQQYLIPQQNLKKINNIPLNFTDKDLDALVTCAPNLEILDLSGCDLLTNEGLAHVPQLQNLKALNLAECEEITNAGLAPLSGLQNLKHLNLTDCERITNVGLAHFAEFPSLTRLNLSGCSNISNSGVAHLSGCPGLEHLSLSGCWKITNVGLAHLEHLLLNSLNLSRCEKITNAGLAAHLSKLQSLEYLNLSGCWKITDAGLPSLNPLQNLKALNLTECEQITDRGIWNLIDHLPKLEELRFSDHQGSRQLKSRKEILQYRNSQKCHERAWMRFTSFTSENSKHILPAVAAVAATFFSYYFQASESS